MTRDAKYTKALPAREIRWHLDRVQSSISAAMNLGALERARSGETSAIERLLVVLNGEKDRLQQMLKEDPLGSRGARNRPKLGAIPRQQRPEYTIFIDECGSHGAPAPHDLPVFCLCSIIVDARVYQGVIEPTWDNFKMKWFPFPGKNGGGAGRDYITHEPDLREGGKNLRHTVGRRHGGVTEFERDLCDFFEQAPFMIVASAVRTDLYYAQYGSERVDAFLPTSVYDQSLDFLLERIGHMFITEDNAPVGTVIAEGRGPLEDAKLQFEYVRLRIEGTQFHHPSTFRQLFQDSVEFRGKTSNDAGLQIVDLVARPIADAIAGRKTGDRWEAIKPKLYDGRMGRPESYGIKCFPEPVPEGLLSP